MSDIEAKLVTIAQFFEVGQPKRFTCLGGAANENFFVQTSSGRYVIKLVREHDAAGLQTLDPFFRALEDHEFPAALYLCNASGEFVFDDGKTVAVIMRQYPGAVPEVDAGSAHAMGVTLAHLHSIPIEGLQMRRTWFHPDFLASGAKDLVSAEASIAIGRLRSVLQGYNVPDGIGLPRSIIHGDYHPYNLLFCGDRLQVVLDWEEVSVGPSLIDIAYATFITFFDESEFDATLFKHFLEGYQSVRKLGIDECEALPQWVRYVALTVSTWIFLRFGSDNLDPELAELANRYWTANLEGWRPPIVRDSL